MFFIRTIAFYFVTARKRSLRRLCFYTCLSVHRRRVVAQHALQVVSQHALQVSSRVYPSMPCRFPGPHPGGAWGSGWGVSRSTLGGGKLRSLAWGVSRPTPGGISMPTPGGCIPACTEADPPRLMATAAGGTHPTGMDFCFISRFVYSNSGWNILKFKDLSLPLFAQQLDFLLHQQ